MQKQQVKDFWVNAAKVDTDQDGLRPTARDPFLQQAVEDVVLRFLPRNESLLDIGCGDGASTLKFAPHCRSVVGVDYAEGFIERAVKSGKQAGSKAEFLVGDANDLSPIRAKYDAFGAAVAIRCLINLPNWDLQVNALSEIAQCLKPGARFLLSEGWEEGWEGLNNLRQRSGLTPVRIAKYNLLISRQKFEEAVRKDFNVVHYESLGFYLLMSRVVQPYLVFPSEPTHRHDLNRIGMELGAKLGIGGRLEDIDYAGVYILEKK